MRFILDLRHLIPSKKLVVKIILLLFTLLNYIGAEAQTSTCNINELRLNAGAGWEYLAKITAECGMRNPNNLGGHMLMLHIPMETEIRAVARQIDKDEFDRFSIILVSGKNDTLSGKFVPDTIVIEISNLQTHNSSLSDPLSGLGQGFFVLKVGIDGVYMDGFRYTNGRSAMLSGWDADTVINYLFDYWQDYFDSADFISSSDSLDR